MGQIGRAGMLGSKGGGSRSMGARIDSMFSINFEIFLTFLTCSFFMITFRKLIRKACMLNVFFDYNSHRLNFRKTKALQRKRKRPSAASSGRLRNQRKQNILLQQ